MWSRRKSLEAGAKLSNTEATTLWPEGKMETCVSDARAQVNNTQAGACLRLNADHKRMSETV